VWRSLSAAAARVVEKIFLDVATVLTQMGALPAVS
jgi:hypothetical protein